LALTSKNQVIGEFRIIDLSENSFLLKKRSPTSFFRRNEKAAKRKTANAVIGANKFTRHQTRVIVVR